GAILLPRLLQGVVVERLGLRVLLRLVVAGEEGAGNRRLFGVGRPGALAVQSQRLFEAADGVVQPAGFAVVDAQVVQAPERVGVVGAGLLRADGQAVAQHFLRVGVLLLPEQVLPQQGHRAGGARVVAAVLLAGLL